MKKTLSVFAILFLVGCTNTLQNIELTAASVETAAKVYVTLPPCSKTVSNSCSKYEIVQTIENSRKAVKTAVLAARKANTEVEKEQTISIAQTALNALSDILSSDLVKSMTGDK